MPERNGEKSSDELVNKDTNAVDGEMGRSKKSKTVLVIKFDCQKCTKICYTESGYHTHLFRAHRIRNVKNYPPQKIEETTVDSVNVFVDRYGSKEEPKYACDECGQLFFNKSSIATHKMHAHTARSDDNTNGNDGEENKSEVNEDTKIDEDEEKIEKGRQILKTMIRKPGSKKKPKICQRKPRSPRKQSKGMKNTQVRRSARIANSSQETIDNETILNSEETKSASEIDKTLPDIILPRRITRSTTIVSKDESKAENVTSPSTEDYQSRSGTTGSKVKRTSKLSENSAQDDDLIDQPSPASVLQKISRIVTRSQTAEQDVNKKEQLNVTIQTKFHKKPKNRITRSKKVETTGDLSQPSLTDNEPRRMRTRSQSSEKSENSVQNRKNLDNSHDATLDVSVSLLNMNIDGGQKERISPMSKTDDKKPENATNRKLPKRKRIHSNDASIDDKAHEKKHKKTNTEDNETTENDTYKNNLDDVQPVNSDKDVSAVTSESSGSRPTQSRMTTHSYTNDERGRSGNISTGIKQTEEHITDSHDDNDESAVTSENSAATQIPTPSRMMTRSSMKNDGDSRNRTTSKNRKNDEESTKGNEDDDDVFQCQICNKTFTDFVQIKQHKIVCTRIKKKYVCPKCNKGFDQKAHFQQHFDYRHTNKKLQFVCEPCKKTFELKKVWQEHNRRLHNTDDYKYLCDTCSRGFFHLGEFKAHRAKHTNIKHVAFVRILLLR